MASLFVAAVGLTHLGLRSAVDCSCNAIAPWGDSALRHSRGAGRSVARDPSGLQHRQSPLAREPLAQALALEVWLEAVVRRVELGELGPSALADVRAQMGAQILRAGEQSIRPEPPGTDVSGQAIQRDSGHVEDEEAPIRWFQVQDGSDPGERRARHA